MEINQTTITFILGLAAIVSIILSVYNSIRNPQVKGESIAQKQQSEIEELKKLYSELKETHIKSVEKDIKDLTMEISNLKTTLVKLATIIEERIPKGQPGLTPPGQ